MKNKPILAWHFASDDGELRKPVNGHTHVEPGLKLHVKPPLIMCERGLHASVRLIDALRYANGALLSRVKLTGKRIIGYDKIVSEYRKHLWTLDATWYLHEFECQAIEHAISQSSIEPCTSLLAAIQDKRDWIDGKIGDEKLNESRSIWELALDDVWDSSRSVAWCDLDKILTKLIGTAKWE